MSEQVKVAVDQVQLPWRRELPTKPGWYLHKPFSEWVWYLYQVDKGSWRMAQNPEEMYATLEKSVRQLKDGWWCGPLAEPDRH